MSKDKGMDESTLARNQKIAAEQAIEDYKTFKNNRLNITASVWTGLIVSAIVILTQALNATIELYINIGIWVYVIDVIVLCIFIHYFYQKLKFQMKDIFSPVFVAQNMVATIKEQPVEIVGKDGKKYYAIPFRDAVFDKSE